LGKKKRGGVAGVTDDKKQDKGVYLLEDAEDKLERDPEISNLLKVMRKMREEVPVNQQLKEKLRRHFINKQAGGGRVEAGNLMAKVHAPFQAEAGKKEKRMQLFQWLFFLIPFLVVIGGMFYFLSEEGEQQPLDQSFYREERQLFYDGLGTKGFSAAVSSGGKIYFINRGSLWQMDYNGQQVKEVMAPESGQVYRQVALAPAGNHLAVIIEAGGKSNLSLLDVKDLNLELLLQSQAGEVFQGPAWSPDGGWLAFALISDQGKREVYKIAVNEANPKPEPQLITLGAHPSWSPDGSLLAIERYNHSSSQAEIWLVREDGTGEVFWGLGSQPQWSNQDKLAFVHQRHWEKVLAYNSAGEPLLVADERVQEIWVADLAGIVKVNLTHLPGPTPEEEARLLREWQEKGAGEKVVWQLRAQVADSQPSWSPDGSFLIVERNSASYSTMLWVKVGGLR
jgi:hypothetical protein